MVSGVVQEFALTNVCKMEVQCGFWSGRGCVDQEYALKNVCKTY